MFSIVICTYNNAEYIKSAVESVVNQTVSKWELLIINDGSTDDTLGVVSFYSSHPSIRIIHHSVNRGKAACLNQAMQLIKGEWMLELDADDWLTLDCIEKIDFVAQLEQEVALLHGDYIEWRERSRDKKLFFSQVKKGMNNFDLNRYLVHPSPLAPRIYRVKHLKKLNGWCLTDICNGRLYEDVYIICVLGKYKKVHYVNEILYHRRLRINSVSNERKKTFDQWRNWLIKELNIRM